MRNATTTKETTMEAIKEAARSLYNARKGRIPHQDRLYYDAMTATPLGRFVVENTEIAMVEVSRNGSKQVELYIVDDGIEMYAGAL
jgi:hypothetical protein